MLPHGAFFQLLSALFGSLLFSSFLHPPSAVFLLLPCVFCLPLLSAFVPPLPFVFSPLLAYFSVLFLSAPSLELVCFVVDKIYLPACLMS